jgi:hypothetical protein
MYDVRMEMPPREPMALKAAVLPMLMRGRRQLINNEISRAFRGTIHRRLTWVVNMLAI